MQVDPIGYDASLPIYLPQPINSKHPLNRGLVSAWVVVPGIYGGRQWFDLCSLNPGTLTNMTSASGWMPTPRRSGYGHILLDGIDDFVSLNSTSAFKPTTPFFVSAWIKTTVSTQSIVFSSYHQNSNVAGIAFGVNVAGTSSGKVSLLSGKNTGTTTPGDYLTVNGTTTISDGNWHHVGGGWDGATLFVYVDGKQENSAAWANAPAYDASNTVRIGCLVANTTPSGFLSGPIDAVSFWSRCLSSSEMRSYYNLSLQRLPGLLNRVSVQSFGYAQYAPPYFSMVSNPIPVQQR